MTDKIRAKSSTFPVQNEQDKLALWRVLDARAYPYTIQITKGLPRSDEQNRTFFMWVKEISEQTHVRIGRVRAELKLRYGIPILRSDNEKFRETYDKFVKHQEYDDKVEFIERTDFPVTRLMTTKQFARMLDDIYEAHTSNGIALTDPE